MVVAFPVCRQDYALAQTQVWWIHKLGGCEKHRASLIAAATLTADDVSRFLGLLRQCSFREVNAIQLKEEDTRGWPFAPNRMFAAAARHMAATSNQPWLWLEPDATPLCPGWIEKLEDAYRKAGKPFLGAAFDKPWKHLTGVAVYPQNVAKFNPPILNAEQLPFDTVRPDLTLPYTQFTPLIQHVWGDIPTNTAPTFPDRKSLELVRPEAVLFHRCKDRSLIARLQERGLPEPDRPKVEVKSDPPRVVVTGLVKHHNPNLVQLLDSLDAMLETVGNWYGIFCVSDLDCQDAREIVAWREKHKRFINLVPEPKRLPAARYQRMAMLRNVCLEAVSAFHYNPEFLLTVDMDIAGFAQWNGLKELLADDTWSAAAVLGLRPRQEIPYFPESSNVEFKGETYCYYDLLAFESNEGWRVLWLDHPPKQWYWHGKVPGTVEFTTRFPLKLKPADGCVKIPVNSAFGPAAFYRWRNIWQFHYDEKSEQCEHQGFNALIRENKFGHVLLVPGVVALYSDPWKHIKPKSLIASVLESILPAPVPKVAPGFVLVTASGIVPSPRSERALMSWRALEKTYNWKIAVLPRPYSRSSADIGDKRATALIREILDYGLKQTKTKDDVVVLVNDDIALLGGLHAELCKKLEEYPGTCSSRRDIVGSVMENLVERPPTNAHLHWGRDLFAFRAGWLADHAHMIPDVYIGGVEWDNMLALMLRKECGGPTEGTWTAAMAKLLTPGELASGNVLHEYHGDACSFARDAVYNVWATVQLCEWGKKYFPKMSFPWAEAVWQKWKQGQLVFKPYEQQRSPSAPRVPAGV